MNEELNVTEEFEAAAEEAGLDVTDMDTDVQPESNSGSSDFLAKAIIVGAGIGGGTLVYLGVKGVKQVGKWVKGKLDMRKIKPDKDGCVAESEAEEVNEESTEEPEQEENVQGKSRKKK